MFHLITGGSGSGKSAYAESCIVGFDGEKRIYIATMYPFDAESHEGIRRHRDMRKEKKFMLNGVTTSLTIMRAGIR